jgi:predicted XRE-type DNA-binding protein
MVKAAAPKAKTRGQEETAVTVERTAGSVYHALGYKDADEMERKARLISAINDTIEAKGLTQIEAADIVGMDQPTLSKLLRGRFRSVSIEKLADMLNALGRDVTILVGALPQREDARGRTFVTVS